MTYKEAKALIDVAGYWIKHVRSPEGKYALDVYEGESRCMYAMPQYVSLETAKRWVTAWVEKGMET